MKSRGFREFEPVRGIVDADSVMGGMSYQVGCFTIDPRAAARFAFSQSFQTQIAY